MPAARRVASAPVGPAVIALVALAAVAASAGLTGCTATGTTAGAPATSPATSAPATTAPAGVTVTVKTFTFNPSPVTAKVGEPVTWRNQDDILHEPTAGTPAAKSDAFTAVELDGKGSSASVTFTAPGTYPYFCAVHESMAGEIVVT